MRTPRLALLLILALACPPRARGAQVEAPLAAAPGPLLLGSLSDPASPLRAAVVSRAASPVGLAPRDSVLDRLSEALLARAAAGPSAREALLGAHPSLAATAVPAYLSALAAGPRPQGAGPRGLSPELDWVFDGAGPALELDGIAGRPEALTLDGRPLEVLGRGEIGIVYAHPRVPGAVIKLTLNRRVMLSDQTLDETAAEEEESLAALGAAGAAPRLLGRSTLAGRPASLRERVYGSTIEDLVGARRFGPAEHAAARGFVRKLARARVAASDLSFGNLMVGGTALDPAPRVLAVDAGPLERLSRDASAEELEAELLAMGVRLGERRDEAFGVVPVYGPPLGVLFDRALERSRTPSAWSRLAAWLGRFRPR